MSFNRFTKLLLLTFSAIFLSVSPPMSSPTQAEIIDLDISGVNPQFANAFRRAEAFWDARVLGYSNTLPRDIQGQLTGSLLIVAATGPQDSDLLGGALGRAGPTTFPNIVRGTIFRERRVAVATVSSMVFADEFLADSTEDDITDVIIHEMGHALGIGSLWADNGLIQQVAGRGAFQYVGINARRAYAIEAGVAGLGRTGFVPIEQQGGGGTAFGHWDDDDPIFNSISRNNRIELMTGFFIPNTERYISRTSLASLVDLHYVVKGFNEDELIPFTRTLANRLVGPNPTAANRGLTGFSSNPFGANRALNLSKTPSQNRARVNIYKQRRK